jgi:hypothetical protein
MSSTSCGSFGTCPYALFIVSFVDIIAFLSIGTPGGSRTHIDQLSVATGYKSAVLPLNYRGSVCGGS